MERDSGTSSKHVTCPCHSQKEYAHCCAPFHQGAHPPTALALMRSRYAAYAMGNAEYIINTTHPDHVDRALPQEEWRQKIKRFSEKTEFIGLDILEFIEGSEESFVTFKAHLQQGGKDASFIEKSRFLKVDGKWFYLDRIQ